MAPLEAGSKPHGLTELDAERQRQRADTAERELARLRELSRKVVLGQASDEEVQELKSLVQGEQAPPS